MEMPLGHLDGSMEHSVVAGFSEIFITRMGKNLARFLVHSFQDVWIVLWQS